MINFHQKANRGGFSLVETLVAVSILLIVIVGPMSISARTAKSSSFASEQIQAFFLAQEGLELTQKLRDDLLLLSATEDVNHWSDFADSTGAYSACFTSSGCGLEWSNTNGVLKPPIACSGASDCKLSLTSGNERSRYTYTTGSDTPFTRRIYFSTASPLDSSREVQVKSVVTWRTGSLVAEQKVELNTFLYNNYVQP